MDAPAGCLVFVSTYSPLELFLRVRHRQSTIGRNGSNGGYDRLCLRPPPGPPRSNHPHECREGFSLPYVPQQPARTEGREQPYQTLAWLPKGREARDSMSPWCGRVDHECAAPLFAPSPTFSYLSHRKRFFLFSFIPVGPDPRYELSTSLGFFFVLVLDVSTHYPDLFGRLWNEMCWRTANASTKQGTSRRRTPCPNAAPTENPTYAFRSQLIFLLLIGVVFVSSSCY